MYSSLPLCLGQFEIDCPELVYHVYMPIKMADLHDIRIPRHLHCFYPLVDQVMLLGGHAGKNMYLTVKKMYVGKNQSANRPGWHLDGYGTDDHNFIWADCMPTEFVTGRFDISSDHNESLRQMEEQAIGREIRTFPKNSLLWLDSSNVHRVADCRKDCVRTFVKISISGEKYNLVGNAHNYMFDYDWPMVARVEDRNHPIAGGK